VIKSIWVPKWILVNGITKNHRGFEGEWQMGAGDTETVRGIVNTLQLCFDGQNAEVYRVSPETILQTFVERIEEWADREHTVRVVWFHQLKFDLQALLSRHDHVWHFAQPESEFILPLSPPKPGTTDATPARKRYARYLQCFVGTGGKPWFAKLYLPSHRLVWLLDTKKFFNRSLKEAAELVKSPFQKLDLPENLGYLDLAGSDEFESYIRNDVLAQWHVGKAIQMEHHKYDVRVCVSLPHMSARVFRHHFFGETDNIPYPPPAVAQAALLAYHGGKNMMRPDLAAGWYRKDPMLDFGEGLYEYDITSAYGWAMTMLPPMQEGEWVRVNEVPHGEYGFLLISGHAHCPFGVIFTHDFRKITGEFEDVWSTTFEVESALKHGCLDLTSVYGYVWRPKPGRRPFEEYARHFFELKKAAPPKTLASEVPKLLVNALYGKTVSSVECGSEYTSDEHGVSHTTPRYKASGIFNPVLGSWITGLVRRKLHDMEHRLWSMHSSTDAVKSALPPSCVPDLGKELGLWGIETGPGDCLLLRPKLYVHLPAQADGKPKVAFHGYQPDSKKSFKERVQLLVERGELALKGEQAEYFVDHCWTAKEAIKGRAKHQPLDFTPVRRILRPETLQKPSQWLFPHKPDLQRLLQPASVEA